MTLEEVLARSAAYAVAILAVLGAAVWYGWELRERLALKLEHFNVTNKRWQAYDDYLKKEGHAPSKTADLHAMPARDSER